MKTNVKNYKTYSVFLVITGLLIGLILALTALASYAQSRFTYGLEAGLGSSQVDMSPYGGMVWSKNQWVEVSFYGAQNDRRRECTTGHPESMYPRFWPQSAIACISNRKANWPSVFRTYLYLSQLLCQP